MNPWFPVALASVVAAATFFLAGYFASRKPAASRTRPLSVPDRLGVPAMLSLLATATRSDAAALLDRDGLLVHGAGAAGQDSIALAGSLASGMAAARRSGSPDTDAVVQAKTDDGRKLRLRYLTVAGGVTPGIYVVATVGAKAAPVPAIEERIVRAVPRVHLA